MANKKIAIYGLIIAVYVTLSLTLGNLAYGLVQVRLSELLLVLCLYDKEYILPVSLGCFLTNVIGVLDGMNPFILDIFIGTLATFLSAILVYLCRKISWFDKPILSLLLPVIVNGLMVGKEISVYLEINFYLSFFYVALGELLSVTILGLIVYKPLGKAIENISK